MDRRNFLTKSIVAGGVAALASAAPAETKSFEKTRIIGISCSPRRGMTTATSVQAALDAAKEVDSRIEVQLIDVGGFNISGWVGGAKPDSPQIAGDDFEVEVEPYLMAPNLGGLIIGSPVYFRSMSALCKALLERLYVMRTPTMRLADKPVGALAVGSFRNGGQELVIEQITTAMCCYEPFIVGGKPSAHQGATLWNDYNDDITKDEFGIKTAKLLGVRVAEAALKAQKIN
jgi:multimeric flavodoxin WrbA